MLESALLSAYLIIACPSILFVVVWEASNPSGRIRSLFAPVDSSIDLSHERFHTVFSTQLEATVHAALVLFPALFAPLILAVYRPLSGTGPWSALLRGTLGLIGGAVVLHILFVLFGAPIVEAWMKTASFSLYLSSITALPLACVLGKDVAAWSRLMACSQPLTVGEVMAYVPASGAMIGTWVGAFPIPLDWDRPWQAWPITCAVGSTLGYMLGLVLATIILLVGGKHFSVNQALRRESKKKIH